MAKFKVEVDQEKCISCGACAAQFDALFEMGDKAKPKNPEVEDLGGSKEDVEGSCPVEAIKVTEMQ